MRMTQLFAPTLREIPTEAEIPSHQLLLRAGMMRKVAAGVYTYLPLGYRVLTKIMRIVREEMDAAGGQELMLPIIQPAELWQESGRWVIYGEEMFRLQDRHQRDFCLGPTHEEIVTALIRTNISSYKQLPLLVYQIQNKYRDEKRPRFGLMRGREFVMKDLYSFDRDPEGMEESYKKMYDAYSKIFSRCGLKFKIVQADSGAIGGNTSHEFMVLAGSGEAELVYCEECEYAANVEKAAAVPDPSMGPVRGDVEKQLVHTPGTKTIAEVARFLGIPEKETLKSLLYEADGDLVCVLLRGDRQINEVKLQRVLDVLNLELAAEETLEKRGIHPGFVGPVDLNVDKIIADLEVPLMPSAVTGANKEDYHYTGVVPERDLKFDVVADIREVEAGEGCQQCGEPLKKARGIEVGQVFQLGTKYSDALNAVYNDEDGQVKKIYMGCYGVGVSRTLAAAIEQNHDDDGIIWPLSIAPYHVVVVPVSDKNESMMGIAQSIYEDLQDLGLEVVLDDRSERAGVKFKDADLIGYPYRITVGKDTIEKGTVDVKCRKTGEQKAVPATEVAQHLYSLISSAT
ncbi:MAG TPA: proline--tRNA ligase [Clostridia bacterium]|nr:proline--tRNA ligase [Clostridia bacterium]